MKPSKAYLQEQELLKKEAPRLFAIAKIEVFTVPQGYFDLLREEDAIRYKFSPSKGKDNHGFNVPEDYFKQQSSDLLHLPELDQKAQDQQPENPFDVPTDYFKTLSGDILAQTTQSAETKVVRINPHATWWKYAASIAAVLLIAATTILLAPGAKKECTTFACLLEQTEFTHDELLDIYLETDMEDTYNYESKETLLSDEELVDYLEEDLEWITDQEIE